MHWLLTLLFISIPLLADDFADEFSDAGDKNSQIMGFSFTGFFEIEQGGNITNAGPMRTGDNKIDWVMANKRFRLQTSKTNANGGIYGKFDFIRDDVWNETYIDIRELRLQYRLSSWLDVSLGKQVSTWGVGDMLFINDLFPKNWNANFLGRDMEALKDSSYSLRTTAYWEKFIFDVVYHPQFAPDTTPKGCVLPVYDPNTQKLVSNSNSCGYENANNLADAQTKSYQDGEYALSLKRKIGFFEAALYGYQGYYKNPKGLKYSNSTLVAHYPELRAYGASLEGQVGPGILSSEIGYYDSIEDKTGSNPLIENSMLKYLVGYKVDLSAKLSVGLQWYRETMMDYKAYEESVSYSAYRKEEHHNTYTARITYKAQQETLIFNLFTYIRPQDKDSFTKIDLTKRLDDNFSITTGASIFTGKDHYEDREFGMLRNEDSVFIRLKFNI